ncbi:hypothetical protein AYO49_03475 [Verrucomicrobiaceae bacterium SCGC AG-212-N21]|nr:hypothetical protein AYO49_03475 [Verrucomicrobiaceae bacterium SCGC AG-212-N21]
MKLSELKMLLKEEGHKHFRVQLPTGFPVPMSFHVTEVGHVRKKFMDCGGVIREVQTCQLQIWVGEDVQHRIEAGKLAKILDKASALLPDDSVPVEIEYEDGVISQYPIESFESRPESVVLKLGSKHTDCLAKELCGLPSPGAEESAGPCCAPGCCA